MENFPYEGEANFFRLKQSDGQSSRKYENSLKDKASRLNFDSFKPEDARVVQFAIRTSDGSAKDRLLIKAKLSLEEAIGF